MTVTPVTTDETIEYAPALSPDGRLLAFLRESEPGYDLFVKQIGGGEPLRVAQGVFGGAELSWLSFASVLTWSPDGQEVAFIRHVPHPDGGVRSVIAAVPALGGNERELATGDEPWERRIAHAQAVDWSPDGTALALTDIEDPGAPPGVFLVSLATGAKRRLTRPPPGLPWGDSSPRFSPDGRAVAFVRGGMPQSDVFVVSTEGGTARQLTRGSYLTGGLDWTADGDSIVFSCIRRPRGQVFSLWRVPASGGDPKPLEIGEGGCWPTLSRSGGRLAYARVAYDRDIWRSGGPTASEEERRPHRFISSTQLDYAPRYIRDGESILFTSQRSGFGEVWMADADGTEPRQITTLEDPATMPGFGSSPDGQQIAVMSGKEGSFDIYLVSLSSGRTQRLTTSPATEGGPSWSRDGRWIYFGTNEGGQTEVWRLPSRGGEAIQVTRDGGALAREWEGHLYFTKSTPLRGSPGLWRMPLGGGDEDQILDFVISNNWGLFDQGICYINFAADPAPTLELYEFASGQISTITVLGKDIEPNGMSLSPDGRWVLFVKREEQSDLMLVESFE
jgi:Tol biopolymer transport system component